MLPLGRIIHFLLAAIVITSAIPSSASEITLEQMDSEIAAIEKGICPGNPTRVALVRCEEACADCSAGVDCRDGVGKCPNPCLGKLNKINRKIMDYNAAVGSCLRRKREQQNAEELARRKELEWQRQQEQKRQHAERERGGLKTELDSLRQGYENAPDYCPKFPSSPECRDWARYDDLIMNQMSEQEREAYLQECCPEQIEENRREHERTEEMMRQARERAERDWQQRQTEADSTARRATCPPGTTPFYPSAAPHVAAGLWCRCANGGQAQVETAWVSETWCK